MPEYIEIDRSIAILGRKKDTANYEAFLLANQFLPIVTLKPDTIPSCQGLILPGGGDITPAFFGETNRGSSSIDTELDILQFQALETAILHQIPVLGICKGMQLINVAFGGTICQDMPDSSAHRYSEGDRYHPTILSPGTFLFEKYGARAIVNSAHHQCIDRPGNGLAIIQRCVPDGCPEALMHETLPILGVQWHPERLDSTRTSVLGAALLSLF